MLLLFKNVILYELSFLLKIRHLSSSLFVQMKKIKLKSTWKSCKSKRLRRKRRKNTKRGRSTNKLRCTIDPAKPCVLACFSYLHPLHPSLHLSHLYQFYRHLTTKIHTSCLPPFHLLPRVSVSPLSMTLCHPPSRGHIPPLPNTHRSAPILEWRGWSLPHIFT